MNTIHPILEFTLERSVDGKLPFVDTEVKQVSNFWYQTKILAALYKKIRQIDLYMLSNPSYELPTQQDFPESTNNSIEQINLISKF